MEGLHTHMEESMYTDINVYLLPIH